MLADTPNVDGPTRANRSLPEELSRGDVPDAGSVGLPIRRMGLEQEFFLVDQRGELRDLADPFLWRCQEAARAKGLDPHCFKPECVKSLVEITTPPCSGLADMARGYLGNLALALKVVSELGLALYPLGTYPLPIKPVLRDDPGYRIQARTIGYDRFSRAGRCAGAHLHIEVPAGTVWPDVKTALDAPVAAQEELLGLYNLATALDPALVAITRACPFYEGRAGGFAARTVHYRSILGFEGLFADLHEVGALSAYAAHVADLGDQQSARYRAWFAAMDLAGVERRLLAWTGGDLHRASWNPIRVSHHGTIEIRSMDANYPEMILALCALICGAAERIRRERLKVRPSRGMRTLELDGDRLLVSRFSYLNGELLAAAVTRGVLDQRVEAYVDSFVRFASAHLEEPELLKPIGSSGSYRTTESEILESFPARGTFVTRDQGFSLVRESCRRMDEQVSSLRQRYDETLPGDERKPGDARVIDTRNSPTISAEGAPLASLRNTQASARATNEGTA